MLFTAPAVGAQAAAAPPGLSISITSANSDVHPGDRLSYVATLRNDGTSAIDGRLVVTVPSYVRISGAAGGDLTGSEASWTVQVPAGGSVTEKVTAVLGGIPKGELRITTLVGLYLGDAAQPVIRSAEADTIAGVTDPAHAASDAPARSGAVISPIGWIGIAAAGILIVAGLVAAFWVLRARRIRLSATHPN